MTEQFTNNASSTLNGGINASVTSIVVNSVTSFPTTGNFRCMIGSTAATGEIIIVTSVNSGTNTLTVQRGQESTTAQTWVSGTTITHILTAGGLSAGTTGGGDLSGSVQNATVIRVQGNSVQSQSLGSSQDGYVFTWNNAGPSWHAAPLPVSGNTTYAGSGAPSTLHNNGDLYYDVSQVPAQGYVQESIALPPSFNGSLSGIFSSTASFTSGTFTCGSTCKLLVAVIQFQQSTDQSVTSVTSTGLTFTRHSFVDNGGANSRFTRIEVWSAPVSSALSQTISIALSAAIDDASVYFFGLNSVGATVFDASADVTGFNATSATSLTLTGVSTSNANDLLFYAVGANASGPPSWAVASGFNKLINVYNGGAVQFSELQICYQFRTSTLSSSSINTGLTTAIAAAAISFAVQGAASSVQWTQFGETPLPTSTVANLPATPTVGQQAVVTDSNTTTFNAAVGGGGTSTMRVWWNGSNWVAG